MARGKVPRTRRDIYQQRERSQARVVYVESHLDNGLQREAGSPTFTSSDGVVTRPAVATVYDPSPGPSPPTSSGSPSGTYLRPVGSSGAGRLRSEAGETGHTYEDSFNGHHVGSGDVECLSSSSTGPEDDVDMATTRRPPRGGVVMANPWMAEIVRPYGMEDAIDASSPRLTQARAAPSAYTGPPVRIKISPSHSQSVVKFPTRQETRDFSLKPRHIKFNLFDILINLVSMGSYLLDIGTDLFLAYMYYSSNHVWWFRLTLFFVLVPSLTMTIFSLKWYIIDHKTLKKLYPSWEPPSRCRWASRVMCLILQVAPVLRYCDTLLYGVRSQKGEEERKRYWHDLMLYEDTDSALLRLFECFMEAAPQLCLQLYIMCTHPGNGPVYLMVGQILAAFTSLCSMAWAMCAYHRALRFSLPSKYNMTWTGVILQFLWHFFTIGARIIAIAMFASYFKAWIFVLAGAHWCAMLVWILIQSTSFCDTKCAEFFFNVVAALVYVFCYFNLTEGHTRLRYLFYYTIVYSENAAMILVWYIFTQTLDIWYHSYAMVAVLAGFFIGIFFQVVYYLKYHPNNLPPCDKNRRIRLWVPLDELVGDQSETSELEMSDMTDGSEVGRSQHDGSNSQSSIRNNTYLEDSDTNECIQPLMGHIC